MLRTDLADFLRNVPGDTSVDVVAWGDPSVGIHTARYNVGAYARGILSLSVTDEPMNAGQLLNAIDHDTLRPREVVAWDMEMGDFEDNAFDVKAVEFVPAVPADEDNDETSAYVQIVLWD